MPNLNAKEYDYRQMYQVKIVETLAKNVYVKAYSEDEAVDKTRALYRDEEIILYPDDFVNLEIGESPVYIITDKKELEDIGDDYYEVPIHD